MHHALRVLVAVALMAEAAAAGSTPAAPAAAASVVRGADVSWPNCPQDPARPPDALRGKPMPGGDTRFVILGVTGGHAFSRNACLASQLAWAKRHHQLTAAYVVTTYPTAAQLKTYGKTGGPYRGTVRASVLPRPMSMR